MNKPLAVRPATAWQALGVKKTKFWDMVKKGEIQTVKSGRATLVVYASLEALIQKAA